MDNEALIQNVKIKHPIIQHVSCHNGAYRVQNVEKKKTYTLSEWKTLSERSEHMPPPPRGSRRRLLQEQQDKLKPNSQIKTLYNTTTDTNFKTQNKKSTKTDSQLQSQPKTVKELTEYDDSQFTTERCADLESAYWKTVTYNSPLYGADMLGSLFPEDFPYWNVAHLDNLLNELPYKIPGVNTAYLYFGMWKSSFAWHLEDMDLYSINFIHFGAPKQWYSISQKDEQRFYELMASIWPEEYKNCREFLRHKTFNVSPSLLQHLGIAVNRLVHYQKEIVVTFPYGYHAGFNYGYNCAESVNFAFESWIPLGLKAQQCRCISDSVGINVAQLFSESMQGEEYEELDSNAEIESMSSDERDSLSSYSDHSEKTKASSTTSLNDDLANLSVDYECMLCPNNGDFELIYSQDGKKKAHRICTLYTPETYSVYDKYDTSKEYLYGVEDIPKERFELKCTYCSTHNRSCAFMGSCIQCAHESCSRNFHPTCLDLSGGEVVPYMKKGMPCLRFYCRFHRHKNINIPHVSSEYRTILKQRLENWASSLLPGDIVQIPTTIKSSSDTLPSTYISTKSHLTSAVVQWNNLDEESVSVRLLPAGTDVVEVMWSDLMCPYPRVIFQEEDFSTKYQVMKVIRKRGRRKGSLGKKNKPTPTPTPPPPPPPPKAQKSRKVYKQRKSKYDIYADARPHYNLPENRIPLASPVISPKINLQKMPSDSNQITNAISPSPSSPQGSVTSSINQQVQQSYVLPSQPEPSGGCEQKYFPQFENLPTTYPNVSPIGVPPGTNWSSDHIYTFNNPYGSPDSQLPLYEAFNPNNVGFGINPQVNPMPPHVIGSGTVAIPSLPSNGHLPSMDPNIGATMISSHPGTRMPHNMNVSPTNNTKPTPPWNSQMSVPLTFDQNQTL